jgi:hypothetical protein
MDVGEVDGVLFLIRRCASTSTLVDTEPASPYQIVLINMRIYLFSAQTSPFQASQFRILLRCVLPQIHGVSHQKVNP